MYIYKAYASPSFPYPSRTISFNDDQRKKPLSSLVCCCSHRLSLPEAPRSPEVKSLPSPSLFYPMMWRRVESKPEPSRSFPFITTTSPSIKSLPEISLIIDGVTYQIRGMENMNITGATTYLTLSHA
ncbi:Uncharacterized protein Rs2_00415 [Raphanus sativus]|nr:Uncharacterized protein Rs2_00415 [Raphanus sativus]